jgi:hypothetical protein
MGTAASIPLLHALLSRPSAKCFFVCYMWMLLGYTQELGDFSATRTCGVPILFPSLPSLYLFPSDHPPCLCVPVVEHEQEQQKKSIQPIDLHICTCGHLSVGLRGYPNVSRVEAGSRTQKRSETPPPQFRSNLQLFVFAWFQQFTPLRLPPILC